MTMVPVAMAERGLLIKPGATGPCASVLTAYGRQMVAENTGLAYAAVFATSANRDNFEDRLSIALEALVRAVQYYNPTLGFKFSTYATWVIRKTLARAIWRQSRGWMPSFDTLTSSVEVPTWDEDPAESERRDRQVDLVRATMARLPERIRLILEARTGCPPESLQSIGNRLGVTKERVRQLEQWGKRRIRIEIEGAELRDMRRSAWTEALR